MAFPEGQKMAPKESKKEIKKYQNMYSRAFKGRGKEERKGSQLKGQKPKAKSQPKVNLHRNDDDDDDDD